MWKWLKLVTGWFIFFGGSILYAQTAVIPVYYCQNSGVKSITAGLSSSNYMLGIIPFCTVTVYLTGTTTKASIYKDSAYTPQNNPFTASSTGSIPPIYAAINTGYDVVLSAGIPPNVYLIPLTLTGLYASSAAGAGTVTSVGLTVPTDESVSGSPVRNSGTLAVTRNSQAANTVLANCSTTATAVPAYCQLSINNILPAPQTITDPTTVSPGSTRYFGFSRNTIYDQAFPQPASLVGQTNEVSTLTNVGRGFNLGNNQTSANYGWSITADRVDSTYVYARGLSDNLEQYTNHYGAGDSHSLFAIANAYGQATDASAEGVEPIYAISTQLPSASGTYSSVSGNPLVTPSNPNGEILTLSSISNGPFSDGGYLFDASQLKFSPTLVSFGVANNAEYISVSGASLPVSSAWGNIVPSSCTANPNGGAWQIPFNEVCNVTLTSGTFVATSGAQYHACLIGPFSEEVPIISVGTVSGGVQQITFSTRYAYDDPSGSSPNAALIMQNGSGGGLCGQGVALSSTISTEPIIYPLAGATSSSTAQMAWCITGACNPNNFPSYRIPVGSVLGIYPMAEVIGLNGGNGGLFNQAQLGTNSISFATGDNLVESLANTYIGAVSRISAVQRTKGFTSTYTMDTSGYFMIDNGTENVGADFRALNLVPNYPYALMAAQSGDGIHTWQNYDVYQTPPTQNVISLGHAQGSNPTTYNLFYMNENSFASSLSYNSTTAGLVWSSNGSTADFQSGTIHAGGSASGNLVCTQNGTNCPSSGTVSSGAAFGVAYYPSSGTTVSATTPFTGLQWDSTSSAPGAATSAQVQTVIGSGVYDVSGAAATAQAASMQKTNNLSDVNSQSAAAANIAAFIKTQSGCTTSGYVWVPASNTCMSSGGSGTITQVIAGTGLSGGGSSGAVTLNLSTPVPSNLGGTGTSTVPTAGQIPVGQTGGLYSPQTVTAGFFGASAAPTLPTPAVATFDMSQGVTGNTATTIIDQTGTGNTGTFHTSTGAPTYTSNGLYFAESQGVDFPSGSIPTADTMCFEANIAPISLNAFIQSGGYYSILSSSLGSSASGSTIGMWYQGQYGNLISSTPGPGIASISIYTNATKTAINNLLYGEVSVCIIKGTSANSTTDTIYLSNATTSYQLQGVSGGIQTTGFMSLCAGTNTFLAGCPGTTFRRIDFFAGQLTGIGSLTQAQAVAKVFSAYANIITNQGVSSTPTQNLQTTLQQDVVGDSIDAGAYITSSSIWYNNRNYTNFTAPSSVNVYAIAGVTLLSEAASEPWRVAPYCNSQQGGAIVNLGGGTNDAYNLSITPQQGWNILVSEINNLSAAGCRVFVRTAISRTGNAAIGGTLDAWFNTYNTLIRNQWSTVSRAIGIKDWAANPYYGATWASNAGNTSGTCVAGGSTYYTASSVDGIGCTHPTAAGEGASGPITSLENNGFNYVFSTYNFSNPYVLTATQTLTMTAGQVYTDATACTSCTLTLPDGVGPTGGVYYINTGSGTVTVQGQTLWGQTQTVTGNGSVASTGAVTLPTGKLVALHIVPLPQATAGIKWVF